MPLITELNILQCSLGTYTLFVNQDPGLFQKLGPGMGDGKSASRGGQLLLPWPKGLSHSSARTIVLEKFQAW